MSAEQTTRLELAGGAGQNDELRAAAEGAVAALRRRVPRVPLPAVIRWRSNRPDEPVTEVSMTDDPTGRTFEASRQLYTRWLTDPLNRDICHLQVLGDLLALRTEESSQLVDRLVRELTAKANEEAHAAQPV